MGAGKLDDEENRRLVVAAATFVAEAEGKVVERLCQYMFSFYNYYVFICVLN